MKKTILLSLILLLSACGGSRLEFNNGTGLDLETVKVTIGDNTQTWNNISLDETFTSDLPLSDSPEPVLIQWETAGQSWEMEYMLIERAADAKRVSILFAPDEVSINYSF